VGLVIDDAIVVVENIVMHRDRGQTRAEAIRSAIREIRVPLVGSTVTPIVVFLPLISITGVEGVFFRALALTVTIALVTSLALALTWTPTLSHYFIRSRGRRRRSEELDEAPSRGMRVYGTVLRFTLEHRLALALFTVVLIGASYVCYSRLGSDLLPEMDEGGFVLDYIMPAGSSLEATNRVITQVEQLLRTTPEVESTSRRTGLQLGLAAVTEANYGDILVKLKRQRDRGVEEVIADVRARVRQAEPVLDIEFTQVLQDMIGDLTSAPEPCIIKLFSNDPDALRRWAPETAKAIGRFTVWWTFWTGSRTPSAAPPRLQRGSGSGGPRRVFAAGSGGRCERHPARRARRDAGSGERPRLHDSRPVPRAHARHARCHPRHRAGERKPARPPASARWPAWCKFRVRPRSAARICSATCR